MQYIFVQWSLLVTYTPIQLHSAIVTVIVVILLVVIVIIVVVLRGLLKGTDK